MMGTAKLNNVDPRAWLADAAELAQPEGASLQTKGNTSITMWIA